MSTFETEEVKMLRETVREFGKREIAPYIDEWDRQATFPRELASKMAEIGLLGGRLSPDIGGSGMTYPMITAVIEEMSYFSAAAGAMVGAPSNSVGMGLAMQGTDEQIDRFLRPFLAGEVHAAAAVTEPHSGTDIVHKMETTAKKDGTNYILNGEKAWISGIENADWVVTFATLDKSKGRKGVTAFIVDIDTPGVTTKHYEDSHGARTFVSGSVFLQDVVVEEDRRLGEEGEGYRILMAGTEIGRLACAARALGMLRATLDVSVDYAKLRETFGQPIGRYQLVQDKIATMATNLDAARLLTYRVAELKEAGVERVQREASMAKLFATNALVAATNEAMQIHGANSHSPEYSVGRLWRDAKSTQIFDGVNEIHKVMIAESVLGYR